MTASARTRTRTSVRIAHHRYPVAALAACLVFGVVELLAPWAAGAERADLHGPLGQLAYWCAGLFSPAASPLRAGSDRQQLAFQLFMAGEASLVLVFIGLLWWRIRPGLMRSAVLDGVLLGALFATSLALNSLAFQVMVATALAALLPPRRALVWLAGLFALGLAIEGWALFDNGLRLNDGSLRAVVAMLAFEHSLLMLGAGLAWLVRQERQARAELAAVNAQLRATQSLLADTVRSSERMRIARDLHDAVGHHLTALMLHLDLATRQSAGQPPAALATANELTRSLLAEVRSVVSAERQDGRVNLRQALELLCAGIPNPTIRLAVGHGVEACPPAMAHALLSCVQEAITNTVRHAGAMSLTIDIHCDADGVTARIADDGRGAGGAAEGNGLSGMRERLAELGGTLVVGRGGRPSRPPGYALEFSLPFAGAGA
ncbi:sensor histidine kinase [Rugamonas apoptosis]|uniref:Histidine kinase n=1 Tax=Rugamonas apoptosis TaxID=2758570 RepID=A0A7W2FEW2_9BURK|nr:histidine kinase [Rugamonas apoptosis]MBA5690433.1 histidine kinase [Rugamonas apoptosis]